MLNEEFVEKGTMKFGVYASYMGVIGGHLAMSIFLSTLLMQSSRNFTVFFGYHFGLHTQTRVRPIDKLDRSTKIRLDASLENESDNGIQYYLTIYAILALLNSAFFKNIFGNI